MLRAFRGAILGTIGVLLAGCGGSLSSLSPDNPANRSSQYQAPTAPVLYVASIDRVNAFDLTARSSTPPNRTIYVHANQIDKNVGMSVFVDGTLDVLQTYYPSTGTTPKCRLVVEPANANGTAAALTSSWDCSPSAGAATGTGIATNVANSAMDTLYFDNTIGTSILERFTQGWGTGQLGPAGNIVTLPGTEVAIATDPQGDDFVDNGTTTVTEYTHDQTDSSCIPPAPGFIISGARRSTRSTPVSNCTPDNTFTTATKAGVATTILGGMAVSPTDGTIYVIGSTGSVQHLLGYPHFADHACNLCGLQSATYDKSFDAATNVTAVAVGSDGTVYVGMTTSNGARVKMFTPHPDDSGNPNAIGNLDALPGDSATIVTALSVYQP